MRQTKNDIIHEPRQLLEAIFTDKNSAGEGALRNSETDMLHFFPARWTTRGRSVLMHWMLSEMNDIVQPDTCTAMHRGNTQQMYSARNVNGPLLCLRVCPY